MSYFFPHTSKNLPVEIKKTLIRDFISADKRMLFISFLSFFGTSFISSYSYQTYFFGIVGGGVAFILSVVAYIFYRGTLIARLLYGIIFMIYPAIMVQQQLGMIEMHFAFFYMISFLMMYKDISSILIAAVVVAIHHVSLTYLQLNGVEVMGVPLLIFGPNCSWTITFIHLTMWTFALIVYIYMILKNTQRFIRIRENSIKIAQQSKEVNDLNRTLEQRVFKRTKALEDSNEELKTVIDNLKKAQEQLIESEKMASLGGLVAGVAHEINTPIGISYTGISHFLDMTEKIEKFYKDDNLGEDDFVKYITNSKKLAEAIFINLDKTAKLINSFKQVAVDQTSENRREFNVKEVINNTILSIYNIIKRTTIHVSVECQENLQITSYPGDFSQILTNLMLNSLNHAYKEGESGEISINVSTDNQMLSLTYSDDGKGISNEILAKIFDPFFTTTREKGGTGLGLNIVYNIVTSKLGGTITCNSELGKGTKFYITFPHMT